MGGGGETHRGRQRETDRDPQRIVVCILSLKLTLFSEPYRKVARII